MNTIKDQLLKLGLKSQPESEKLPNLKDSSKDELSTKDSFLEYFISASVNKAGLDVFFKNISMLGLRLSKTDKKKLWQIYNSVIEKNFLDVTTLSEELGTINLVSASIRFLHKEKTNDQKVKYRKKTGQNKAAHEPSLIFEKPSTKDKIEQIRGTVQIGFGLESKVKTARVKRVDVLLDDKTMPVKSSDKSIIYAAGWSLKDTKD